MIQGGDGGDGPKDIQAFVKRHNLTYPVLFTPPFAPIYKVSAKDTNAGSPYPINVLIDKQGKIAYITNVYKADEMIAQIRKVLGL